MSGRRTPPPYQLRKADGYSKGLSGGLLLAYPMLEGGGTKLANYGSWGSAADLTVSNATWSRREGIQGLTFSAANSVASGSLSKTIPQQWSYIFWAKLDTSPGAGSMDLFSLQGASQANVRAWADNSGVWSWQKRITADTYSVQPVADYPTDGARLIVATFSGIDTQPPVQQRAGGSVNGLPIQPAAYNSFNIGSGAQVTDVAGIYLGNNAGLTSAWNGVIGPVYFWNRVISDAEIWQLWQDPYAPLRRHSGYISNPGLMISQADSIVTDIASGKSDYSRQIFSDNTALFINLTDTYFYQNSPTDSTNTFAQTPVMINLSETYTYQASPTDSINISPPNGTQTPVTITLSDTYTYQADPTDSASGNATNTLMVINLADTYAYQTGPTDSYDITPPGGTQTPLSITLSDTYTYANAPTDSSASQLT